MARDSAQSATLGAAVAELSGAKILVTDSPKNVWMHATWGVAFAASREPGCVNIHFSSDAKASVRRATTS
jgi:hypothetical protein